MAKTARKKTTAKKGGQEKDQREAARADRPLDGAGHRCGAAYGGRVQLDVGRAGDARVKRMIYPPGFAGRRT